MIVRQALHHNVAATGFRSRIAGIDASRLSRSKLFDAEYEKVAAGKSGRHQRKGMP
jgi:hypothetical protein